MKPTDCDTTQEPDGTASLERSLYLFKSVDEDLSDSFIRELHSMDAKPGPITVFINSSGGLESDGYAIYDALRLARNRVVAIGLGCVASISAVIMQACDRRLLSPECTLTIHDGTAATTDEMDSHAAIRIGKESALSNLRYATILSTRSGQKLKAVQGLCREDTTLTAAQAVRMGFADAVLKVTRPSSTRSKNRKTSP